LFLPPWFWADLPSEFIWYTQGVQLRRTREFPTRKHHILFLGQIFSHGDVHEAWAIYSFIGVAGVAWNSWLGTAQLPFLYHDALLAFWVRLRDALEDWSQRETPQWRLWGGHFPWCRLGRVARLNIPEVRANWAKTRHCINCIITVTMHVPVIQVERYIKNLARCNDAMNILGFLMES
jgi:hypothetical protein